MEFKMDNSFKYVMGGSVFVLLGAFIWKTQDMLSPLLIGGILLFILAGMRTHDMARRLFAGVMVILAAWLFLNAQAVVLMFVAAFVLAYLFDPLVDWIEKIHIPRTLATLFLLFFSLGLIVLSGAILIPSLVGEIQELIRRVPNMVNNIAGFVQQNLPRTLEFLHIDSMELEERLMAELPRRVQQLAAGVLKGITGLGSFLGQVFNIILIPVLTFYLLKDFDRIRGWGLGLLPKQYRNHTYFYLWRLNRIFGGYLRGQIICSTIVGILTGTGLSLFGLPFAILLGFMTGILNVIPFIGLYISLGVALLTGFFLPDPLTAMLKIAGVFLLVQALDSYVIQPKIVGERVGLHPVAVMGAVLLFSRFLGFWGLVVGVPTAALIKFFIDEWKRHQEWREVRARKGIDDSTGG